MAMRWPPFPEQTLVLLALSLLGCGNCDDEVKVVGRFLDAPENLSCASDDDCVVVQTGCHPYPRSTCGQGQLNRQGADSKRWRALSNDLFDCQDEPCTQCLARLLPSCTQGYCGGPP